jgi:predicted nucleic acid-binding protein
VRIVLDTNVFISGIFFSGPPHRILQGWRNGRVQLVLTPDILEEYRRVAEVFHENTPFLGIKEAMLGLQAVRWAP